MTNNTKTITNCTIANVHSLFPMCDIAKAVLDGKTTVTAADLKDAGVVESYDAVRKTAGAIFDKAELAEAVRQSKGLVNVTADDTDNLHPIANIEAELRDLINQWFAYFGNREPRKRPDPASNKPVPYRPLYSVKQTDYYTIGKIASQAQEMAKNGKVYDQFFINLLTVTARIIYGEPMSVLPADHIAEVMRNEKEKAVERAEKAKKTRAENQVKAEKALAERRAAEQHTRELEAKITKMEAEAINISEVIALVQKSHAHKAEKDAIIAALCGKSGKSNVTEMIDDGKAHGKTENETAA